MIHSVRLILFVGFLALVFSSASNVMADHLCGDCNQNSFINVTDAFLAEQIAQGLLTPSADQEIDCDVNNDDTISSADE